MQYVTKRKSVLLFFLVLSFFLFLPVVCASDWSFNKNDWLFGLSSTPTPTPSPTATTSPASSINPQTTNSPTLTPIPTQQSTQTPTTSPTNSPVIPEFNAFLLPILLVSVLAVTVLVSQLRRKEQKSGA